MPKSYQHKLQPDSFRPESPPLFHQSKFPIFQSGDTPIPFQTLQRSDCQFQNYFFAREFSSGYFMESFFNCSHESQDILWLLIFLEFPINPQEQLSPNEFIFFGILSTTSHIPQYLVTPCLHGYFIANEIIGKGKINQKLSCLKISFNQIRGNRILKNLSRANGLN